MRKRQDKVTEAVQIPCPCRDNAGLCIIGGMCQPLPACIKILNEPSKVPLRKVYIVLESGGVWEG